VLASEESSVRFYLQRVRGVLPDGAHDIVRESLLAVCESHAAKPYARLGPVLQVAAERKALDRRRRSRFQCPLLDDSPDCSPLPDANARFAQEERVVDTALCAEPSREREVIHRRLVEEEDFATIGADFELSADEARTVFHNALRRIQRRVREACDS
jgi:DNA-directed RNA polymerase specialized sigma24 family protein